MLLLSDCYQPLHRPCFVFLFVLSKTSASARERFLFFITGARRTFSKNIGERARKVFIFYYARSTDFEEKRGSVNRLDCHML